MKWCEHGIAICVGGENNKDRWNFCPICGAKRPEEPKKLWEKLKVAWDNSTELDYDDYWGLKACAKASVEHFIEIIEKEIAPNKYWSDIKTKELIQTLRKSL